MILLLGSSGYIGSEFVQELLCRQYKWSGMSREVYTDRIRFYSVISTNRDLVSLVINCAAFIPRNGGSICDNDPGETIKANLLLPSNISRICMDFGIPIMHVSTGCLWSDGKTHSEDDPPQRAFKGDSGFYIGTKVLAEEEVRKCPAHYIVRVRLPFDEFDNHRNYLTKISKYGTIFDHCNSLSHRRDFVKACLDLWSISAPFGTYNVTNPGSMKATDICSELIRRGIRKDMPVIERNRPGDCILSVDKLLNSGVKIRTVEEAMRESLDKWVSEGGR